MEWPTVKKITNLQNSGRLKQFYLILHYFVEFSLPKFSFESDQKGSSVCGELYTEHAENI